MSIGGQDEDGVSGHKNWAQRVGSRKESDAMRDHISWLAAAETGFQFWDNDEDALYDRL